MRPALIRPLVAFALVFAALAAQAQGVALTGTMGSRALLVIDGQPQVLAVGDSARGVKLLSLDGDQARVDVKGQVIALRVGAAQVSVGGPAGASGREMVMTAGPGGHFLADGSINGRAVRFMVDTGATNIALSTAEATRLGIDWQRGQRGYASTANGTIAVYRVNLRSVRVGDVEVANVDATVGAGPMPHVLLGNSFLSRFSMRRESDVMRLELR